MRVALAAVAMTVAGLGQAQPDASELVRRVAAKYASEKQYELAAAIHVMTRREPDGEALREETLSMHVAFSSPDKVMMEGLAQGVDAFDLYSNGKEAWAYSPSRNAYMALRRGQAPAQPLDERSLRDEDLVPYALQTAAAAMQGFALVGFESARVVREEKIGDAECWVVEVHDATTPPAGGLMWIDKNRTVILRQEETFSTGGVKETTRADYTTMKIDEPLPDSLFTFVPPAGAKRVESFLGQLH